MAWMVVLVGAYGRVRPGTGDGALAVEVGVVCVLLLVLLAVPFHRRAESVSLDVQRECVRIDGGAPRAVSAVLAYVARVERDRRDLVLLVEQAGQWSSVLLEDMPREAAVRWLEGSVVERTSSRSPRPRLVVSGYAPLAVAGGASVTWAGATLFRGGGLDLIALLGPPIALVLRVALELRRQGRAHVACCRP